MPEVGNKHTGRRLSLERCRELVGTDISDAELEKVRDVLYALAEVVVDEVGQRRLRGHQGKVQSPPC